MAESGMVHKNRNWSHFGDEISCTIWRLEHGDPMPDNQAMRFCIECSRFVEAKTLNNHEHWQDAKT